MKRIVFLAILALAGAPFLTSCTKSPASGTATAPAKETWQCPMHPEVVKDHEGDCPICGMKLVPVEASSSRPESSGPPAGFISVEIDPRKRQMLGLKTVEVKREPFETSIRTVGRVTYDERRIHHVHTRYEAFVEHVAADFTGKSVRKGEVLAHVYSPELFATQKEYLLALKASRTLANSTVSNVASGGRQLLDAARQRLLLWEITPADIEALEKRGEPVKSLPLYAPISGVVISRMAYHGMKVMPADTLFDIVDLSSVWVLADVYEYELPRLSLGQRGTMTLSYWPGREWNGTVTYIYPSVDEKTRTVKVRLEFTNPRGELKPEMYADIVIKRGEREVLSIPDEAVIESGTRKVVFLAGQEGVLTPREITVGDHAGGRYEVKSGLSEGDLVALGANFLLDSESRLKSALAALTSGSPPAPPAKHEH